MAETFWEQHRTSGFRQLSCRDGNWRVVDDGLEHCDSGYFIDGDLLGLRRADGCWAWPLQLSEKSWCVMRDFRLAFLAALERFGIAPDADLDRSFALCGAAVSRAPRKDGFVALAEVVRPKSPMRQRRPSGSIRTTVRVACPAPARLPACEGA